MIQNITISKPFHYQNIDENYSLVRKPTISINQFYVGLNEISGRNVNLSSKQRSIIEKGEGPLWIIAGPGSGKTEVLVRRCLKLLLGDDIDPRSIIITTFTEKAARNHSLYSILFQSYHCSIRILHILLLK